MKDRRALIRTELSPLYLPYYDALCGELSPEWQPYCGLRSPDKQAPLFRAGLTKATPGKSPHNYGCASDWCVWEGDQPEWPDFHDHIWQEYLRACEKVGLHCLDFERPHNELSIKVKWSAVCAVYEQNGMNAAQAFIREQIRR